MFGMENFKGCLNDAKEALSLSAFQTVVRHAFGTCEPADRKADKMGIDARCIFQADIEDVRVRVSFDVQLKGSSRTLETTQYNGRECWRLPVEKASLANYRAWTNNELLLVLVLFPRDDEYENWLKIERDRSVLLNQMYWVPMEQAGDAETLV